MFSLVTDDVCGTCSLSLVNKPLKDFSYSSPALLSITLAHSIDCAAHSSLT